MPDAQSTSGTTGGFGDHGSGNRCGRGEAERAGHGQAAVHAPHRERDDLDVGVRSGGRPHEHEPRHGRSILRRVRRVDGAADGHGGRGTHSFGIREEDGIRVQIGDRAPRHLADGIRDSRYVEIAGAGHISNLEQPAEFNAALVDFLAGRDGSAGA